MKKKWIYPILALIFALFLFKVIPHNDLNPSVQKPNHSMNFPVQSEATTEEKEDNSNNKYLSITYTFGDPSIESGRSMDFYTYDLSTKKLVSRAQLPYSSQYALGAVSIPDNKIYYSYRAINDKENPDHLYEFDLSNGKSFQLEAKNRAYNDIIPLNGNLLVKTVPTHAIGTALFSLTTKNFSYLYNKSLNKSGYIDFPYTTRPVALNYNFKYKRFINIYVKENDLYDLGVRTGKKSLDYCIALVDADLTIKNTYLFTLPPTLYSDITAAAQLSSDSVLIMVEVPSNDDKLETAYEFYLINYSNQSCQKIDSPFTNMRYIDDFVTIDGGNSYYVSGVTNTNTSGLFTYNCSDNKVHPILLDDLDKDAHIVNFCLLEK